MPSSQWIYKIEGSLTLALGLFRFGTYWSHWSASSSGIEGNMKGDGTLLGSTLVVGPGEQGILYQHRSREFKDRVDPKEVLEAVERIPKNN